MSHYTSENDKSFANRITFDYVAQLEERLATTNMTQAELAKKLKVGESTVSQVLNLYRSNLNLETIVKYARAVGMKVALVAYDDYDPTNQNGPVGPEIFAQSWERLGRPRDVWSVSEASYATSQSSFNVPDWMFGSVTTSTFGGSPNTANELGYIPHYLVPLSNKVTLTNARI
jgi:transcriptional regulator with XRE-family HTH domain